MKVDSEDFSEQWTDTLSIRIRIQLRLPSDPEGYQSSDEESEGTERSSLPLPAGAFTRCSAASLMALRNLPPEAPLVLLTPFLVPAALSDSAPDEPHRRDPFEDLGRQLALRHPNISHVPYVPSIGFTDTHAGFVMNSEAVITVICEPGHALKRDSMREQHQFAEAALKAFNSRAMTMPGDGEIVLVQCATDEARRRAHCAFANVIETVFYNEDLAAYLARNIFGRD